MFRLNRWDYSTMTLLFVSRLLVCLFVDAPCIRKCWLTISMLKTCWLKNICICSLATLMHSCSYELTAKFSKPKMSRIPTVQLLPLRRINRISFFFKFLPQNIHYLSGGCFILSWKQTVAALRGGGAAGQVPQLKPARGEGPPTHVTSCFAKIIQIMLLI